MSEAVSPSVKPFVAPKPLHAGNYMQAVMNTVLDGLIIIDDRGLVKSFNPAAVRIFGYAPEEVIGRNVKMLMPEPYHGEHDAYLDNYHRTGAAKVIGIGREVSGRRKDGTVFAMELGVNAMQMNGMRMFVGTVRDISQRKKTELERERLIEKLMESNTELERFAYICSHDLQEPLRMISNFSQRLIIHLGDGLDEKGAHYMHYVLDGAQHARQMINDVLTYARLDQEVSAIDGEKVLEHVLFGLQERIRETKAAVTHDPLPHVFVQPTHLRQLLQNLISNALKFCHTQPEVHINVEREGMFWKFCVRDNGIGIAAEHQQKLFTIFQRLHSREQYPGTGIGLAVCKKVTQKYGGKVWLESTLGEGSRFYFTLPAIQPEVAQEAA